MTSRARRAARELIPPVVARRLAERAPGHLRFVDGFADWGAATAAARGYEESSILAQVRSATEDVVAGRAAMERDGVTFERLEIRWPVAAAMLWQAARHGRLRVLDFGGSLGSSYRQLAPLLDGVDVRWGVVEQPSYVDAGHAFEDGRLSFHGTIADCVAAIEPTIALLSGVLQYLPDPHDILRQVDGSGVEAILVDRTPVLDGPEDLPVLQQVPKQIYDASYPAWILSWSRLLADLPAWRIVDTFPGIEAEHRTTGGVEFEWRGVLARRGVT